MLIPIGFFGGAAGENWIALLPSSYASRIATDSSGNTYTQGSSNDSGYRMVITKRNSLGIVQWQKFVGDNNIDEAYGIGLDESGNIYAAGRIRPFGSYSAAFLCQLNSSGVLQWQRTLNRAYDESSQNLVVTPGTYIFLLGNANFSLYIYNGFSAQFDSGGNYYNGKYPNVPDPGGWAGGITVDNNGNRYQSGYAISGGYPRYYVIKRDSAWNYQWDRNLSWSNGDAYAADIVAYGTNLYTVGYAGPYNQSKATIVKFTDSGSVTWQRGLETSGTTNGYSAVAVDSSENVYAVGYTTIDTKMTPLVSKYNSSGVLQWQRTIVANGTAWNLNDVSIVGTKMYLTGTIGSYGVTIQLPTDGSGVGAVAAAGYNFTYAASSLNEVTIAMSSSTPGYSTMDINMTAASSSYSTGNSTLTQTLENF